MICIFEIESLFVLVDKNLLAKGVRMALSHDAIMRLSMFTTVMGRRFAGV